MIFLIDLAIGHPLYFIKHLKASSFMYSELLSVSARLYNLLFCLQLSQITFRKNVFVASNLKQNVKRRLAAQYGPIVNKKISKQSLCAGTRGLVDNCPFHPYDSSCSPRCCMCFKNRIHFLQPTDFVVNNLLC